MINKDFYREMIGTYGLLNGMPEGEERAEEILEAIFRHIELDKATSHSEGVVEGMTTAHEINKEHIDKLYFRQHERNGSK